MKQKIATNSLGEMRYIPLLTFSERVGITLRTARSWVYAGKIRIKPKQNKNDKVYVDWFAWNDLI